MSRGIKKLALALTAVVVAAGMTVISQSPPARADGEGPPVLPAGFYDQKVADVDGATALAFVPDGRMLIINRHGGLYIYQGNALVPAPALNIESKLCQNR